MLPRFLTSSSTKSNCSRLRRPIQPRLNCPSITIPLCGHSRRVTINSLPLTGSRVIIGCIDPLLLIHWLICLAAQAQCPPFFPVCCVFVKSLVIFTVYSEILALATNFVKYIGNKNQIIVVNCLVFDKIYQDMVRSPHPQLP